MITKQIPFFSDEIAIIPHTASYARYIGKRITIRRFSKSKPVSLELVLDGADSGDYIVTTINGEFIQGKET